LLNKKCRIGAFCGIDKRYVDETHIKEVADAGIDFVFVESGFSREQIQFIGECCDKYNIDFLITDDKLYGPMGKYSESKEITSHYNGFKGFMGNFINDEPNAEQYDYLSKAIDAYKKSMPDKMAVINLIGTVYMEPYACPFETADRLIERAKNDGASIIAVDIHAEATAEKKAIAFYLDGKVSFVFGTHTHVQTADIQILPDGTGFITDLGMTGPFLSVLGVKPELSIRKIKDKVPVRFANAEGECVLEGCIFDVTRDGKCESTEALRIF